METAFATEANELAKRLQTGVPFVADPWSELGRACGMTADAVLAQVRSFGDSGHLREISAVLEGSRLGYDSALVAGRVPPERVDEVAAIVAAHPTVTHDYLRDHEMNLWFTIAAGPGLSLERILGALARLARVDGFSPLRRTRTFKIGVRFDLESLENATQASPGASVQAGVSTLSERERGLLRALQRPLPYVARPFAVLAEQAGSSEAELLSFAQARLGDVVRRYVATFRHRKLGVRGNGMVVWNVPEERLEAVGASLAAAPEVSHCYAREVLERFPYALYTMIHARDEDSVRAIAERLAGGVGVADYRVLFSTREYKKARLRYFLDEEIEWYRQHVEAS